MTDFYSLKIDLIQYKGRHKCVPYIELYYILLSLKIYRL